MNLMYTIYEKIGTSSDHFGFIVLLIFAIIFVCMCLFVIVSENRNSGCRSVGYTVSASYIIAGIMVFMIVSAIVSWNTGLVYKNTPVIATLVGEEEKIVQYRSNSFRSDVFVYYETPEGPVSFRRESGVAYPKTVILYKN